MSAEEYSWQPKRLSDEEIQALLDSLAPEHPAPRKPGQRIWDVIDEIWSDVPDEELARIPPSDQVDHYLYGTPLPG
ncbi:MAG: hypothetical protein WED87_06020 [Dehalococcoidia bacterium]